MGARRQEVKKDEQQAIEFARTDRLSTIKILLQETKQAEKECKVKQWQYRRKDGKGENIILRDTFGKLVK